MLLTHKRYEVSGDWYQPKAQLLSKPSVVLAEYHETSSSSGDWSGYFLQKIGKTYQLILFTQENLYPEDGFELVTGEVVQTFKSEPNKADVEKVIRKEIVNSENLSLYALYDIYRDFKQNRYGRIQDIRNALTHRRLIVFDSLITSVDDKTDKHNIDSNTLLQETVGLMRLTKAATIYLINFVNTEEEKKKKANGKPILDMYVDTSQFL